MRAYRLHNPDKIDKKPLKLENLSIPHPGPGQLLLQVNACGICHTDLHTVEGDLTLPVRPITPGHQIVGTIREKGENCSHYQVGERMGVAWLGQACGSCSYCLGGMENLCAEARFTGLHIDGGYAEYVVVDERFAFSLPAAFTAFEAAPLLCGGIIGFRSLRLSGIQPGGKLGLYGFGSSAHLAIQVAMYWDCEVYVFTRSPHHQEHALELGAVWTGQAQDTPPALLDAAVTFAPAGWIVPEALRHLRPGGTVAINAIHMSPIPELPYDLIYGERVVRSVANFTRSDARDFLDIATKIPIKTDYEIFTFDMANEVLARVKDSAIRGAAVLQI